MDILQGRRKQLLRWVDKQVYTGNLRLTVLGFSIAMDGLCWRVFVKKS